MARRKAVRVGDLQVEALSHLVPVSFSESSWGRREEWRAMLVHSI
jgi:hypothetical protein